MYRRVVCITSLTLSLTLWLEIASSQPPPARLSPRNDLSVMAREPFQIFDNLYFVGTQDHGAWAVTTSEGIIVIDALYDYAVEGAVVEGLRKLGLDPEDIAYVVISHGHGDHHGGAAYLQEQFGARIVMGGPDWDRDHVPIEPSKRFTP